jgi:tetraacyldisaccharide 4'-kinase
MVSDGTKVLVAPTVSGDEPYLIAANVPGAGVMVGADRYAAGLTAMEKLNPDIFILDDGFQHWKLHRDMDVLCINALNPFGNGCLIPAGILREPAAAVRRGTIVLITNTDMASESAVAATEATVRRHNAAAPVLRAAYRVTAVRRLADNAVTAADTFAPKEAALVSALGENRGFRKTAENAGFRVAGHVALRDHYWYNINNIKMFLARFPKDLPIFITAKDAVRLNDLLPALPLHDRERFFSLDIELDISGEEQWQRAIRKILQSS